MSWLPCCTSYSTQQSSTQQNPVASGDKSTYFSSYQLSWAFGHSKMCPVQPEHRGTSALGESQLEQQSTAFSSETLPRDHHRAWCTCLCILNTDLPQLFLQNKQSPCCPGLASEHFLGSLCIQAELVLLSWAGTAAACA